MWGGESLEITLTVPLNFIFVKVWDDELAASAQLWADQCTNKHLPFGFQKLNDSSKFNISSDFDYDQKL